MKRSALFVFVIAVTSICSGQWLEREVVIGDTLGGISLEGGIVVNPISGNVYVESDPTQVFDPATMEKLHGPDGMGVVTFCQSDGKGYVVGDEKFVVLDAFADTVSGTIATLLFPTVHAYSVTSNRLYLGSSDDSRLFVLDPASDSLVDTIDIEAAVLSLLWDSAWNRLYVGTNADSGQLKVFDCATNTLLAEVQLGITEAWTLGLSSGSSKLYCAGVPYTPVVVVSTESLVTVGAVPLLSWPDTMVYSPFTDRLFCPRGDTMYIVDCRGDTIRTWLGAAAAPVVTSRLDGRAYLSRSGTPLVLVLDEDDVVVDSIPIPVSPGNGISALTLRSERQELYGITSSHVVFVVDIPGDTVTGALDYTTYTPRQMVHNPAGNKLYLLCPGRDDVLVVDSTFGTPKHIPGGVTGTYAGTVLNPALNRLYVADYGQLRMIDCNSDALIRSIFLQGATRTLPLMVPYLNKLYVFPTTGSSGDGVYVYDCLRDTAVQLFGLSDDVPCAVYDPRSNRVFFACADAPSVRVLDPVADSVVKTFDIAGGSARGRFALDLDLGRLYYTDQTPEVIVTIDVMTDSIIASESLPWDADSMFINRRLGKLFICSRDTTQVLVLDCGQGKIVDTFDVGYPFAWGVMNDRNDKLYLSHGAVVDCRYDSVVTVLQPDTLTPRCMAWDPIDNRVFQATTSWLYVYRDGPYGIEEQRPGVTRTMLTVLGSPARDAVSVRLQIPPGQTGRLAVYDATGRLAHSASVIRSSTLCLDLGAEPAGVYFVSLEVDRARTTDKVILQH